MCFNLEYKGKVGFLGKHFGSKRGSRDGDQKQEEEEESKGLLMKEIEKWKKKQEQNEKASRDQHDLPDLSKCL